MDKAGTDKAGTRYHFSSHITSIMAMFLYGKNETSNRAWISAPYCSAGFPVDGYFFRGSGPDFLSADTRLTDVLEEKNRTGRPFGSDDFYAAIERLTGIDTRPGTPGRPPKKQ